MKKGRPVLGAISGVFFGLFIALDLQQFSIMPLTTATLIGLPILFGVIGLLLGMWAPFRGSRTSPAVASADAGAQAGSSSGAI